MGLRDRPSVPYSAASRISCACCAIVLGLFVPAAAGAQTRDLIHAGAARKALIVGNDAYAKAPALQSAVNDANDLGAALRESGFQVEVVTDADRQSMERAIRRFAGSLGSGDVALFHFSGHGLQMDGENYLIPVDFELTDEIAAKYDAYSVSEIHDRMAASKAALNIVTLDACRNNGFRSFRGGGSGLAAMHAAQGSFLAFATAPGKTADDNPEGRNGTFTGAMLEALSAKGLELEQVFRRVRQLVIDQTAGAQVPWTSSSIVGNFYFKVVIEDATFAPTQPSGDVALQVELAYWNSIDESEEPGPFEDYLRRYPEGQFTELARRKIVEMSAVGESSRLAESELPVRPEETSSRPIKVNSLDGLEYVRIPPGEFLMGAVPGDADARDGERPRHRVEITKGFWMSRTEVPVGAYKRFVAATSRKMPGPPFRNPSWGKEDHPIVNVDWNEAQAYCEWAGGRLPSEAEWEYAARGGKEGWKYPWGNEITRANAKYDTTEGKAPVGIYAANGFELYDMAGNVWEWCADWYGENYYKSSPSEDPPGPDKGTYKIFRGGSWGYNSPRLLRCSYRDSIDPGEGANYLGFRCVREVSP